MCVRVCVPACERVCACVYIKHVVCPLKNVLDSPSANLCTAWTLCTVQFIKKLDVLRLYYIRMYVQALLRFYSKKSRTMGLVEAGKQKPYG